MAAAAPPAPAVSPLPVAPTPTPIAPGFAPNFPTSRDASIEQALRLASSLFGRTAIGIGPTNPRWNTFTGEMSPENITSAIDQCNAGLPFTLLDMYRRAIEQDAHLAGVTEQRFAGVISKSDRIEPPKSLSRDKYAVSVSNWMQAVREQIENFDRARFALLWADGAGYAVSEIIWGYRPLTWFDAEGERRTRTYCVPVKLELVDGRGIRFDISTDEPLLWLSLDNVSGYARLPPAKFIFHESFGVQSTIERRGFMRSCIWLHSMKQWCLRDLAEFLHMYGLPQMVAEYDRKQFPFEEAKRIAATVQQYLGQGGVPTVPMGGFSLRTDTPPVQGALVHAQAAEFLNGEMTKRITLGPLTMESNGGSYGLGSIHEGGAFDGRLLTANNMCTSLRRFLWAPTLAMNAGRLALDLGAPPVELMAALPDYHCRLLREDTPEARQKVFSQAMRDGLTVSQKQYRAELHLDEPQDKADTLEGEAVSVPSSGKVVSAVQGSEGAAAPPPAPASNQGTDPPAAAPRPKETT